jgi:hypothetical protein
LRIRTETSVLVMSGVFLLGHGQTNQQSDRGQSGSGCGCQHGVEE